jgi:hypothetical protein
VHRRVSLRLDISWANFTIPGTPLGEWEYHINLAIYLV